MLIHNRDITNYASSYGIELCIENDRGQWTQDPKNLVQIVKEINSKSLNLNWDPANLIGLNLGYDFEEHYNNLNKFISYVHIKDGIVNAEGNSIVNCMVGDGIVGWVKQFELLLSDETVLEKEPLEKVAAIGELNAFQHKGFWQCMDSVRDKQYLENLWKKEEAPWA